MQLELEQLVGLTVEAVEHPSDGDFIVLHMTGGVVLYAGDEPTAYGPAPVVQPTRPGVRLEDF